MFLAVDIGNSNIKFGVFDGPTLAAKHKIPTPRDLQDADPAAFLRDALDFPVTDSLICSVVPEINEFIIAAIAQRFRVTGRIVRNDEDFGLDIRYDPLVNAGTDRLVGAFTAAELFGTPCVVASFGTALTVDAVNADRVLLGGVIAPGPRAMARALAANTSRLPEVDLSDFPASIIQVTTKQAIRSGILNGYLGMAERLVKSVKAECDPTAKVLATGGFAGFVSNHSEVIDIVDSDLILKGLRLCYDRWKRNDFFS